jgi:hypothetical protein
MQVNRDRADAGGWRPARCLLRCTHPAVAREVAVPENPPVFDPDAYAAAAAALLGLPLQPAWVEPVTANLRVLAAAAELVGGFPLPDEAEAAPRFGA